MSFSNGRAPFKCKTECILAESFFGDKKVFVEPSNEKGGKARVAVNETNSGAHALVYKVALRFTGSDIRCLIDVLLSSGSDLPDEIKRMILRLGIDPNKAECKCFIVAYLFERLRRPGAEADLAMLFSYLVYNDLTCGLQSTTVVRNSSDPLIRILSKRLIYNPATLNSIRRYKFADLLRFGCWIDESGHFRSGGSRRTIAYRNAEELFLQFARFEVKRFAWKRMKRAGKEKLLLIAQSTFIARLRLGTRSQRMATSRRTRLYYPRTGQLALLLAIIISILFVAMSI